MALILKKKLSLANLCTPINSLLFTPHSSTSNLSYVLINSTQLISEMATAYQHTVCGFEKKPSGNPLPKRGRIKNKILTKVFSAIIDSSQKKNKRRKDKKKEVAIGSWSSTYRSQGSSSHPETWGAVF